MKLTDFNLESITERLPLVASGGDCWVDVRSSNSNEFSIAKARFDKSISKCLISERELKKTTVALGEEIEENTELFEKLISILISSLVVGWSFDDEVTIEAVSSFLHNNKNIRSAVDELATSIAAKESLAKKPQ